MPNRHWRKSQSEDFFVKDSKLRGYRSRSVYKLLEIDQKYKIFKNVKSLVDIGSTPGGWSEYARNKIHPGNLLALDINAMDPIEGVTFIQGSIEDKEIQDLILEKNNRNRFDLITVSYTHLTLPTTPYV